jgi:hypothetical protein
MMGNPEPQPSPQAFAPIAATASVGSKKAGKGGSPGKLFRSVALSGGLFAVIMLNVMPQAYANDIIPDGTDVVDSFFGNAAKEGELGVRPTLGGVNLFVFYVIYQIVFQTFLRVKNPGGANVAFINGTRVVEGKVASQRVAPFVRSLQETVEAARDAAQGNSTSNSARQK